MNQHPDLIRQQKRADYYSQAYAEGVEKLASLRHEHRILKTDLKLYQWLAFTGWLTLVIVCMVGEF